MVGIAPRARKSWQRGPFNDAGRPILMAMQRWVMTGPDVLGLEQAFLDDRSDLYIERVIADIHDPHWYIVKRAHDDNNLRPPRLAGPFPDLDVAKAAYVLLTP